MAIKRYIADADNTITNAFKANLTERAVSGNMGQSDILESFSIYAQASTASSELSRILIKFPITGTSDGYASYDRLQGNIPASGSVSFYLRMFNARHSQTVPKNFDLVVSAISQNWNEGNGLDMDNYSDEETSNWINPVSGVYWANAAGRSTALITVTSHGSIGNGETFVLEDASGVSTTYQFKAAVPFGSQPGGTAGGTVELGFGGASSNANIASAISASIAATTNAGFTAVVTDSTKVTVTQTTAGTTGDKSNTDSVNGVTVGDFTGGANVQGGSYITDSSSSFTASFINGFEDVELDITPLVEQWIQSAGNTLGTKANYGVGVRLSSAEESATTSYYTKKFFARGSQYYFKRPYIEARWDSSEKDDRGNFYYSSSLASATDNLNTIYLYNYVRGQLKNIPGVGTGSIYVNIYSGSSANTAPSGHKQSMSVGGGVRSADLTVVTGGYVSPGIYSCSFAYTGSSSLTRIFDVWHSGSNQYFTGTIDPKNLISYSTNPNQKFVSHLTNLKPAYSVANTSARFRLYTRKKDWSPTIYTVSSNEAPIDLVEDAYYKVCRVSDNLDVIPYGTGSDNNTRLSYDASGSYFDLDMSLLEADNTYAIKFVYYLNSQYVEQSEEFKFRVE